MQIQISAEQLRLLRKALNRRLLELHDELVHTDDREFRVELRHDLDHLEELIKQLDRGSSDRRAS